MIKFCEKISFLCSKEIKLQVYHSFTLQLTPMEARKRRMRRERNKIAAAKCRDRRRLLTDQLEGQTQMLNQQYQHLKYQQYQLEEEKKHLQQLLDDHLRKNKCRLVNCNVTSTFPTDSNPADVIPHENSAFSNFVVPPSDALQLSTASFAGPSTATTSTFEHRRQADSKSGNENTHESSMLKLL